MATETIGREWRLLTQDEFDTVAESHHETLAEKSRAEAVALSKRLKKLSDKYRDLARQQRREARGKAAPKGARPATGNANTRRKHAIFQGARKRVKAQIARIDDHNSKATQRELSQHALDMRQEARTNEGRPESRTTHTGLDPSGNTRAPRYPHLDREKGRVSQAVKRAQARRDAVG